MPWPMRTCARGSSTLGRSCRRASARRPKRSARFGRRKSRSGGPSSRQLISKGNEAAPSSAWGQNLPPGTKVGGDGTCSDSGRQRARNPIPGAMPLASCGAARIFRVRRSIDRVLDLVPVLHRLAGAPVSPRVLHLAGEFGGLGRVDAGLDLLLRVFYPVIEAVDRFLGNPADVRFRTAEVTIDKFADMVDIGKINRSIRAARCREIVDGVKYSLAPDHVTLVATNVVEVLL